MFVFTVFFDGFHLFSPLKKVKDIGNMIIGNLILKSLNAVKALSSRTVSIDCDRIPYRFENVSIKKILNWIVVETSMLFRPNRPWGWPTHLQVEPSTLCNLKCAFCPVTTGMHRPTGYMDVDIFKKVIDETGDFVFLILLWDWGEPFLNPSIYEMIAYAKKRDIKIVSSTNGHVFSRGHNGEALVASGIDVIIFAMDGISQDTYERYRKGGDLEAVITGIEKVVAAKHALNSKTPLINLRFLAMKHNEHEISKLKDFARSLEVDALTVKTLNPYDQGECHSTKADGTEFIPLNPFYQRFEYDPKNHARIRHTRNPCKRLWNNPVIHWDGKVSPCTFDPHDNYAVGDLTKDTFKDIWRGVPFAKLRRQFRKDYQKIALCSGCTNAFKGGALSTDIIAEAHFFNPAISRWSSSSR
jgi:radical SAM protein with 4Fe4S-binding SPASM domain